MIMKNTTSIKEILFKDFQKEVGENKNNEYISYMKSGGIAMKIQS
jgi:hypothetical protein